MLLLDKRSPRPSPPSAATIGFFDGLHAGHRWLLGCMRSEAERQGLEPLVITFGEHPRSVLTGTAGPVLLTTTDEKMQLLESLGFKRIYMLDFTREMAALTSRQFMETYLRDSLNVRSLVIGHDHHFGSDRDATLAQYQAFGSELGISIVAATRFDNNICTPSSTAIRQAIQSGDVGSARQLLGYCYSINGRVVSGQRLGHRIGFPTANIVADDPRKLIPADGVYAAVASVGGKSCRVMVNIGRRPTVDTSGTRTIEAHIIDYDGDLYGCQLRVHFVERLRSERHFDSLEALRRQLEQDREAVLATPIDTASMAAFR